MQSAATLINQLVVRKIDPPLRGFFSKAVVYHGLLIMSHEVVSDLALIEAHRRTAMMLHGMPEVLQNLLEAKAEFHVIGKMQKTSDLPEHRRRHRKIRPGRTNFDQRNRGMGGLFSSCGEENLLTPRRNLNFDDARDTFVHEFSHCLVDFGFDDLMRDKIKEQFRRSKRLWPTFAATNHDEYFAEMSMWYFGSHGDLGLLYPKPVEGREWLRSHDPGSCRLLDMIYGGRIVPASYCPQVGEGWADHTATTAFELFGCEDDFSLVAPP